MGNRPPMGMPRLPGMPGMPAIPGMPLAPGMPNGPQLPGNPQPPPEAVQAVQKQQKEQHEKVRHSTHHSLDQARDRTEHYIPKNISRINNNGVGSLDRLVRHQRAPTIHYDDIRAAQSQGRWGKVLRMGLSMSFSRGSTIQGLGYAIEGMANMNHNQRASVLNQLNAIEPDGNDWRQKLTLTGLRTAAERGMLSHGYRPVEGEQTLQAQPVLNGDTLFSMIDRLFPDRANVIREEIRNGAVAGVLTERKKLPPRTFVYFTSDGYPMAIGLTPNEQPKATLYRKSHNIVDADRNGTVEYLRQKLQPGDILFFNERHRPFWKRAAISIGLMAQAASEDEENNPFLHVGVYDEDANGEPIVHHVVEGGGQQHVKLKDLLRTHYNTLAAGRLQNPDTAMRFLHAAREVVASTKHYDYRSLYRRFLHLANKREGRDDGQSLHELSSRPDAAVCVDVVARAAQQVGNNELIMSNGRPAETAMDMLKQLKLVTAINVDEKVAQPRTPIERFNSFWFGKPPEAAAPQQPTFMGRLFGGRGAQVDDARTPSYSQAA